MYRGWSRKFFALRGPIKILLEAGAVFEMRFVLLGRPRVVECGRVLRCQVRPLRPTRATEILNLHDRWQDRFIVVVFQSWLQNVSLENFLLLVDIKGTSVIVLLKKFHFALVDFISDDAWVFLEVF